MHTPPALYFLHWKFLTPFISLQRTGQTQISPFITTLMLSLFLSNAQNGLSTIPEFLCSASFLFLSNAQDGLRSAHLSQPWCFLYFSPRCFLCFSPTHRTDCRRGGCMVVPGAVVSPGHTKRLSLLPCRAPHNSPCTLMRTWLRQMGLTLRLVAAEYLPVRSLRR